MTTEAVRDARRALVAAGARLHERQPCGHWSAIPGAGCAGETTCPVCECTCDQIPDGDEPSSYEEGVLF